MYWPVKACRLSSLQFGYRFFSVRIIRFKLMAFEKYHNSLVTMGIQWISVKWSLHHNGTITVFPTKSKKVQICKNISSGFADKFNDI